MQIAMSLRSGFPNPPSSPELALRVPWCMGSGEFREELYSRADEVLDVADGFVHRLLLGLVHVEREDLFNTIGAQNAGDADEEALATVLGGDVVFLLAEGGGSDDAFLVADDGFDHFDGAGAGGVPGAGAHKLDDLAATDLGAIDAGLDLFGGEEVGDGDAVDAGEAGEGDHVVAVAAEEEALDVFDADAEFHGEEGFVASDIEGTGLTEDAVGGEAGDLPHHVDHGVEGVADDDDDGVGGVLLDVLGDALDDAGVDADEVIAALAGLTGHTGGDDDDIGIFDIAVIEGAGELGIELFDGAAAGQVEGFALGHVEFGLVFDRDIQEDDIAQFLHGDGAGAFASDVS
jgi:hypothetical protein